MTDKNKVLIDFSLIKDANDALYKAVQLMLKITEHFSSHETMSREEMSLFCKNLESYRGQNEK